MSGAGRGHAVSQTATAASQVLGSWLDHDHFQRRRAARRRSSSVAPTKPEVAATDRNDIAIAWRSRAADGNSVARARFKGADEPFGRRGHGLAARPRPGRRPRRVHRRRPRRRLRGRDGPGHAGRADADRRGLRPPAGRAVHRVLAGLQAQDAPGAALAARASSCGARRRFRVYMDGVADRPDDRTTRSCPATPLTTGKHTWQVEAVDRAGQTTRSRVRTLRIDATPPTLKVTVSGKRAAGAGAEDHASRRPTRRRRARPHHGRLRRQVGDDAARARRATATSAARSRCKVAAVDKAGNVTRKEVKLRIKKS